MINLLNEDGATAIGIRYNLNGTNPQTGNVAYAKREVIISAGTYGSPLLPMRSGIGPNEVLESAGIPQIKELPVGKNFEGHPLVRLHRILNNQSLSQEPFKDNYVAPWGTSVQIQVYLRRPKSKGTAKLNPNDKNGPPIIDFDLPGDSRYEDILLDAIKQTLNIFEGTETYQRFGATIFCEPLPDCKHLHFRSDKYWRCFIRKTIRPGQHPSGTCSTNSVVDSKLRVLEIRKLFVIDTSVMQVITNANLHAFQLTVTGQSLLITP